MLQTKNKLTVFHDNNSAFSDYSYEALDFARDTFTIDLVASQDYLYVGFSKPINTFYVELSTANTNANTFTAQYHNGSSWASITNYHDDTKGLTRSGFMSWDRNLEDESSTEINSSTKYFYRFKPSADHSSTIISGLNIVFADDLDLKREFYEIANYLPGSESSFILSHVATRDHIIQELRNDGRYKSDLNTGKLKDITAFDLLDISQVKLAATYLCLSKIFSNVSDREDDLYFFKSRGYMSLYNESMKLFYLNMDQDDDGIEDEGERMAPATPRLIRR